MGVVMKKIRKMFVVVLVAIVLLCSITFLASAKTQKLSVGSTNIIAGNKGRIEIVVENFDGFKGGFNFEIKFPTIAKIDNVYLENNKLSCDDYIITNDNTLVIIGTCNYGDDFVLGEKTYFYVDFAVGSDVIKGEYQIVVTEKTTLVSANDTSKFISLDTANGTISVHDVSFKKADINEDENIDETDLAILRKKILGVELGDTFNMYAADLNDDGICDVLDMVELGNRLRFAVVYLSTNGSDENDGNTSSAPVKSLEKALETVSDYGTIHILDTAVVDDSFMWSAHGKTINIAGNILDASMVSTFKVGDNVTFLSGTSLKFKSGANVYANGYNFKICENVSVIGKPYLYGGSDTNVKSTSLEIYSGSYKWIFGGSNEANVEGDTNVIVGGNVNSDLNASDHNGDVLLLGGCNSGIVGGNTNVVVKDNAKFTFVYGAGYNTGSNVKGLSKTDFYGGSFVGSYGGSKFGACSGTLINFYGGNIEQILGGSEGNLIVGDTRINLLGGTVTRRIYGGCYNDYNGSWKTRHHVGGNTTVFLSGNANIQLNTRFDDLGIFACTRYGSHYDDENSTIIYENEAAKAKFQTMVGQQTSWIQNSWCPAAKNYVVQD